MGHLLGFAFEKKESINDHSYPTFATKIKQQVKHYIATDILPIPLQYEDKTGLSYIQSKHTHRQNLRRFITKLADSNIKGVVKLLASME